MLKGIQASAGYAHAKVYKLQRPVLLITEKISNKEEELEKFEKALIQTRNAIIAIKEKAYGSLSKDDLSIFDAHIQITKDPALIEQIKSLINTQSINAEFAVESIANMYINMFESMEDEYFRERAFDIKDVTYRLKSHIMGVDIVDLSLINEPSIIVAKDLSPSDTAQLDVNYTKGFITEVGGKTSHTAIMANSLEIPAIVGVGAGFDKINHGDEVIMDANKGEIIVNPSLPQILFFNQNVKKYERYRKKLLELKDDVTVTVDGHNVELSGNIGNFTDVEAVLKNGGEGIGLYRTEFLYMDKAKMPSEQEQFLAYKEVLQAMNGLPVVVRTLDIGGDKELSYLDLPEEMNPFLGYRAIRLCLDRPEMFRVQLRALIRASVYGPLKIMFPMIATIEEFNEAKTIYQQEFDRLIIEGFNVSDNIEVGMMIELPSAAILADEFAKVADFFSIGTNDLIQYLFAADRMNEKVAYLYQPLNPALLRLVKMVIDAGHKENIEVGMCGEMSGNLQAIPILLGLGLDEFSMPASDILEARQLIMSLSFEDTEKLAKQALQCASERDVIKLLKAKNFD